jgi:hypothetical protein
MKMTALSTTTATIEALGRPAAPATNPQYDPAFLSGNGALGWIGRTGFLKSLLARKADRDLRRAMDRLSKTSAHLMADVCRADAAIPAGAMAGTARPPVALRPAQRPAMPTARRAPVSALSMLPARAVGKGHATVAQ